MIVRRIENVRDVEAAFERFRGVLAENNFRIESGGADRVIGTRTGKMQKRESPLKWASRIVLVRHGRNLQIDAEFDGLKKTSRYMVLIVIGFGLFLGIVFWIAFARSVSGNVLTFLPLLTCVMLALSFRNKMRSLRDQMLIALDALGHSIAESGGGEVRVPAGAPKPSNPRLEILRSGFFLLITIFAAFYMFPRGMGSLMHDTVRVVVPGTHTVRFDESEVYTVFYENRARLDGKRYNTSRDWADAELILTSVSTGEAVTVTGRSSTADNEYPGHAGYAIASFTLDEAGDYVLSVESNHFEEKRVISIAHFDVSKISWIVVSLVIIFTLGLHFLFSVVMESIRLFRT